MSFKQANLRSIFSNNEGWQNNQRILFDHETDKGGKGVVESPVKTETLEFLEERVMFKGDRVSGNVLLHPVLSCFVGVSLLQGVQISGQKIFNF